MALVVWALKTCISVWGGSSTAPSITAAPALSKPPVLYKIRQALWDNTNCTGEPVDVAVYHSGECRVMSSIQMVDDVNEFGILRPVPKNVTFSIVPS